MKTIHVATCLAFGALLGSAVVLADVESRSGLPAPVIFVKNSAITKAVKANIAAAHIVGVAHVHVGTNRDGVVWLTGRARTQEAADEAASIARETEHVTAVYNGVKVRKDG